MKNSIFQKYNHKRNKIFLFLFIITSMWIPAYQCDKENSKTETEGYYTCSMHPQVIEHEPGQCPICGMDLVFQNTAVPGSDKKNQNESHDNQEENMDMAEKLYTCPMHPEVMKDEPGNCPICGMDLVPIEHKGHQEHQEHKGHSSADHSQSKESAGYYTCPMHPQVVSDRKGQCPICGMDLVHKKENSTKASPGSFQFSVTGPTLTNSNLLTAPVKSERFTRKGRYSGHIAFNEDPQKLVVINTKYDGWIEELFISKEGQSVKKGEKIMGMYSPQILAAKEEYITTYMSLKSLYENGDMSMLEKDPTLKAARQKLIYLDVSSDQIQQMEKNEKAGRLTYYHSPISGVVVKKEVLQGSYVKAGQELFRLADLNKLWLLIHIFEKDLSFIKKGQMVHVKTTAYSDEEFQGSVDLIYPFLDEVSRDIKVRIVISNKNKKLKPGMFAEVRVDAPLSGLSKLVPESAVIYSGEKSYVFVSLGKGTFEMRPVKVKLASGGEAVISSGLEKDELVVVNGQFLLDSEASLKEAVSRVKASSHQGHTH